ncbi:hypothetical protein [Bradyrhizobium elkanii]
MSGQAFDEAAEEWLIWSVFERSGYRFASRKRDQTKAGAFSSEVGSGSRQENATQTKAGAFSSEVGSGSREENATKQKDTSMIRFNRIGPCSERPQEHLETGARA